MKKDLREWRPGLVPIIVELALAAVFFTVRLLRTQARLPVLLSLCDGLCIAGLLYLFWAVASGIATGAGMFWIALFVFVVMAIILMVLSHMKGRRDEMYILLVHYTGDGIEEKVRRAIGTHPYKIKSKTLRKHDTEMAIEVRVRKNDMTFVDALRGDDAINDLTLVQYSGDYID